jgi:hypothetical protein
MIAKPPDGKYACSTNQQHQTQILMSEFKFSCPQCDQHLQCDTQFAGREIQCPGCNVLIRIPPVPGQTANFTPESGMTWATHVPSGKAPVSKPPPVSPDKNLPKPPAN